MIIGLWTRIEVFQIFAKRFTKFTVLKEKPSKGYMWSGERLTTIHVATRPENVWPEVWTKIGKAAQMIEKQEWAIGRPKLDNPRRLRGMPFIDPKDGEYREIIKKTPGESWKFQWMRQCRARKQQRNTSQNFKNKACMYRGGA